METGLVGKTVIVTGAASHIGRGIALAFAREKANVVIADIDAPQAEKTLAAVNAAGAAGLFVKCDVTSGPDVEAMLAACMSRFGQVDVLVNNVGRPSAGLLSGQSDEAIRKQLDVNLVGAINCIRAILPHMMTRKQGRIVNIGSEAGRTGDPKRPVYAACKGAIIALTKSVARDAGPFEITVNTVCPHSVIPTNVEDEAGAGSMFSPSSGLFGRRMLRAQPSAEAREASLSEFAIKRFGTAEDVAHAVVFLASDGAGYITGQTLSVNGGHSMF